QPPYQNNPNSKSSQAVKPSRNIGVLAVLLFALAGLLSGFAFGGFGHSKPVSSTTKTYKTPTAQQGKTPTPKVTRSTTPDIFIAPPDIQPSSYSEIADGTTSYTISSQIKEKITLKPITSTEVTCKMWLTKSLESTNDMLNANGYAIFHNVDTLSTPFANEIADGLTFSGSAGTQPCNAQGSTVWNYTINPSVSHGTYYIFVLADWKGKHFNWASIAVTIKKNA
ncbi:MAG: hypothetical protein M3Z24_09685, partial [Chloroflexota bacterium]|nr:hypothetical protein [Chloroflexota bacterium]